MFTDLKIQLKAQGLMSEVLIFVDSAHLIAKVKCLHLAAIKNSKMKEKNTDKDCWYSKIRAPYERVFAHQNNRVHYIGIAKKQFTGFMQAICFNLKRLLVIAPSNLLLN